MQERKYKILAARHVTQGQRVRFEPPFSALRTKAAEGSRTPRRFATYEPPKFRQVLECGCPLPLSFEPRRVPNGFRRTQGKHDDAKPRSGDFICPFYLRSSGNRWRSILSSAIRRRTAKAFVA